MVEKIQAIRGMNDILPGQTYAWRVLEQTFAACVASYGYKEIRFPYVESTALFKRSIGPVSDIVEKEMYTFNDLNGDQLTLRPEGTAGCVRACVEHGLLRHQQQKLWYSGPMFRHEKPQKGRYRQFSQFGVEVFGLAGVGIELELLLMCRELWASLGLTEIVRLHLNTLGSAQERQQYRDLLIEYFSANQADLDDESQRRLHRNPMRILDSKNPEMQALIHAAPTVQSVLGDDSKDHFDSLCNGLTELGIKYTIDPFLVRGLDYYEHTVFEWMTDRLGSQATICGGGRFDLLIPQLGGNPTPAVGFAMGAERILLLMAAQQPLIEPAIDIMVLTLGEQALVCALKLAESLRTAFGCCVSVNTSGAKFKRQFKDADQSGARWALVLGEDEVLSRTVGVKPLRLNDPQITMSHDQLISYFSENLKGEVHVSLHD